MDIEVFQPGAEHQAAFLTAVRRRQLGLNRWVSPPDTPEKYAKYLERYAGDTHRSYLAMASNGSLVGCINLNEIVRGALQSAYLGYYAFSPHQAGQGAHEKRPWPPWCRAVLPSTRCIDWRPTSNPPTSALSAWSRHWVSDWKAIRRAI
jgi:ribosomal-protein-alanine N-acetyltransferase